MIDIQHLYFNYDSQSIFSDFNIKIDSGNIIGLLGKNGSGKSTFLKLISGLIFPKNGEINVLGFEPYKRSPYFLQNIYILPEEFHLPNVKIQTLVKSFSPFYPNFDVNEFYDYIHQFEVPEEKTFEKMSLGQKKKAVISFALACNTPLLLMDEPTNGLDIISKNTFKTIMQSISIENRNIIISTHQAHDLETIINHLIVLDTQGILMNHKLSELKSHFEFQMNKNTLDTDNVLFYEMNMDQSFNYVRSVKSKTEDHFVPLELLYKSLISQPNMYKNKS